MNIHTKLQVTTSERQLPFEVVALVLQGGGALGAYQARVYEALSEAGIHRNWLAGMSIGAINAAIIAGNPRGARVDRLREFRTQLCADGPWRGAGELSQCAPHVASRQPEKETRKVKGKGLREHMRSVGIYSAWKQYPG